MERPDTPVGVGGSRDAAAVLRDDGYLIFRSRQDAAPIVAMFGSEEPPTLLEPKASATGGKWSHSDHYGFGYFPWHTDGAVAVLPPRWMLLECELVEGSSRTELLDPSAELVRRLRKCAMRVRNRTGRVRYVAPVSPTADGKHRLRWDPRVCEINDAALRVLIEDEPPTGICEWVEGRVLLVDNWRLLHRRPAVDPSAQRRLIRSYVRTA